MSTDPFHAFLATSGVSGRPPAEDLARSAAEKARQIVRLRREIAARDGLRLENCATALAAAFRTGASLFAFGSGGSATAAAEHLARVFTQPPWGLRLRATALADPSVITGLADDVGFEYVFSRELATLARPGDIALGLSTDGGSANLLRAFEEARRQRLTTVGLAVAPGATIAEPGRVEHLFLVPSGSRLRAQELQATIYHTLWELIQRAL